MLAGQSLFAGVGKSECPIGLEVEYESSVRIKLTNVPVDLFGAIDGTIGKSAGWVCVVVGFVGNFAFECCSLADGLVM